MPSSQRLWSAINRRPYVCTDCQKWLTARVAHQQQRQISHAHLRKIQVAEDQWKARAQAVQQGHTKSILEILEERGLVNQVVGNRDELNRVLIERRVGVYCGIDPTAASLHVGHLVPFMALAWMYIYGYASTFLLGGFTASIGDPTDRLKARDEPENFVRRNNMQAMFDQLKRLAAGIERVAERRGYHREWAWRRSVRNNNDWWIKVSVKEYMRLLGKFMRMGPLLGRDSVKNRLTRGDGMSYAEFSYPLIQAWDWWELYQTGTQIQIGGADQFGNILAGAEAVNHIKEADKIWRVKHDKDTKGYKTSFDPMGFTVPLLTTSSGEKFGKSAGNAVWIDRQLTSSFDLYQFFLRTADDDVECYLKLFTFQPLEDIASIMKKHAMDASQRTAQHVLAFDFVEMVHGLGPAEEAQKAHKQAFSKNLSLDDVKLQMEKPRTNANLGSQGRPIGIHPSTTKHAAPLDQESTFDVRIQLPRSLVERQPVSRILWSAGLVGSRNEGQRLINQRGAYVGGKIGKNGQPEPLDDSVSYIPITDSKFSFIESLIVDNILVLRSGKWKKKFVQIVSDQEYQASGQSCPGWDIESGRPDWAVKIDNDQTTQTDLQAEEHFRNEGAIHKLEQERKTEARERRKQSAELGGFGVVTDVKFGSQ